MWRQYHGTAYATHLNVASVPSGARRPRIEVNEVVYVTGPREPAFILNLSEDGMAIQAMEILQPGQLLPFAFPLPDTKGEVRGAARIVWSDRSGQAVRLQTSPSSTVFSCGSG